MSGETHDALLLRYVQALEDSELRMDERQRLAEASITRRLRINIATELLGDSHFELSKEMSREDAEVVRMACRQALAVADVLILEAEVKP